MKEIKLTMNLVALVDDEDFEALNKRKWFAQKGRNTFYARTSYRKNGVKKSERMHRVILGLTDSNLLADHIDGNGLNNQKSNLRTASYSDNNANRKTKINDTSKYLGVCFNASNGLWKAQITKNYKKHNLGFFAKEINAAKAYNEAAKKLHGEFANLNILY
jgi:hypothetical protein